MVESVTYQLDDALRANVELAALAAHAFDDAVSLAAMPLGLADVQVTFRDDPDAAIPQWGVGGVTEDEHHVEVALDASRHPTAVHVTSTLVHEFHHAMRWRHTSLDADLRDRLSSEGLAVMFETDLVGEPFYAQVDLDATVVARALEQLDVRPCDAGRWFFGASDAPMGFGYSLGARLCREYAQRTGASIAELLIMPSSEIISASTARGRL